MPPLRIGRTSGNSSQATDHALVLDLRRGRKATLTTVRMHALALTASKFGDMTQIWLVTLGSVPVASSDC